MLGDLSYKDSLSGDILALPITKSKEYDKN
jgi:hypothetical protein